MKRMYNFERDYDMHYGDGMMREALQEALDHAVREGEVDLEYRSVLGPGFRFGGAASQHHHNPNNIRGMNHHKPNTNPYSKNPHQGPKHFAFGNMIFDYEEAHLYESSSSGQFSDAKKIVYKREKIVQDMQDRRMERVERRRQEDETQAKERRRRAYDSADSSDGNDASCMIMWTIMNDSDEWWWIGICTLLHVAQFARYELNKRVRLVSLWI